MHQISQVWLRVECVEVRWLLYQPREIADFGRRALGVRRRITKMIDGQTAKFSPPLGGRDLFFQLPHARRKSQRDADRLPWRHDTRNHGAGGQPACDKGPHRRTAFSGPTSSPPNHLITADSNPGHPGTETIMSKDPNHSTKAVLWVDARIVSFPADRSLLNKRDLKALGIWSSTAFFKFSCKTLSSST